MILDFLDLGEGVGTSVRDDELDWFVKSLTTDWQSGLITQILFVVFTGDTDWCLLHYDEGPVRS
jgi:hypothetical protein